MTVSPTAAPRTIRIGPLPRRFRKPSRLRTGSLESIPLCFPMDDCATPPRNSKTLAQLAHQRSHKSTQAGVLTRGPGGRTHTPVKAEEVPAG